jgi:hypothetical protein
MYQRHRLLVSQYFVLKILKLTLVAFTQDYILLLTKVESTEQLRCSLISGAPEIDESLNAPLRIVQL